MKPISEMTPEDVRLGWLLNAYVLWLFNLRDKATDRHGSNVVEGAD